MEEWRDLNLLLDRITTACLPPAGMYNKNMKIKNRSAQKLGSRGGQKTAKTHGREFYRKIGKLGMKKRWQKPAAGIA